MSKSPIAAMVALSLVASAAASAIAHPRFPTTAEKPYPPSGFWDQQRKNGA